jgi:hypothetical protein
MLWSPYILWNIANGGQSLQFYANYGGHGGGPLDLIVNQLVLLGPPTLLIAAAGVYYCLGATAGQPYRAFGWVYVTLIAIFVLLNVKPYFLTAAYPPFIASGAVWVAHRWQGQRARAALVSACLLFGVLLAPLAMPLLPPATFAQTYGAISGLGNGAAGQRNAGVFPQYLGDRFGWDTMTATVARAYHQLPAAQQAQACILTINYGEASALELLGKPDHLPRVISGHNNYYLWGPGRCSGQVILAVGFAPSDLQPFWGSVTQVAFITCAYCQAEENNLPVYLATQPLFAGSLTTVWVDFKHYN